MADELTPPHEPARFPRRLRWQDLSRTGQVVACVVFFLAYLGPAHEMNTTAAYPWYGKWLLLSPWLVMAGLLLWPGRDRLPLNPGMIGVLAVYICCAVVSLGELILLREAPLNPHRLEIVNAIVTAGLAALITGPMLRLYDKADEERRAKAERSAPADPARDIGSGTS